MSRIAERALEAGDIPASDAVWMALRLSQGRFSLHAIAWLDYLASPRARLPGGLDRSLDVRMRRARRLGYRGTFEDYGLVEKWFAEEGLNPF